MNVFVDHRNHLQNDALYIEESFVDEFFYLRAFDLNIIHMSVDPIICLHD
jgi:hypothetical protein